MAPKEQTTSKLLLYRVANHNGGVVFAKESRARLIDQIHRALKCARTWAEFRHLMPQDEYASLVRTYADIGEALPHDAESFDAEMIPGWSDGEYPAWLQREMGKFISHDVLSRHGVLKPTAVNGAFWWIAPDQLPQIEAELIAGGWRVRHAPELLFW